MAEEDGVHVTDGIGGDEVSLCKWPNGSEGIPDGVPAEPIDYTPSPTELIPFPDGEKVLMVSFEGIFILSNSKAIRLLPDENKIREQIKWLKEKSVGVNDEHPLGLGLEMQHGTFSKDGKFIAVGCQDGDHYVFNPKGELIKKITPVSSYPHHAIFSSDNKTLALNSCHFYSGETIAVPVSALSQSDPKANQPKTDYPIIENRSRVYAAVSRKDEFIIGDADGYIRAFSTNGEQRWQHFIGSTIGDIDISADGKTLVVGTYAGFVSIINLDQKKQPAYQIGNGNHEEIRRWLFWKNESKPLIW